MGEKARRLAGTIKKIKSGMRILTLSRLEIAKTFMQDCGSDGTVKVQLDPQAKAIGFTRLKPNEKQ